MKTWAWSILAFLAFMAGCAQGYYAKGPAYPEAAPAAKMSGMTYQNPESPAEQQMRIWGEERGR